MDRSAVGLMLPAMAVPPDPDADATYDISDAQSGLLAALLTLHLKKANLRWHMNRSHLRDFHLMLDDHSVKTVAETDVLAEQVRKLGHLTRYPIGDISRNHRSLEYDALHGMVQDLQGGLREDNGYMVRRMPEVHRHGAGAE